MTLAPISLSELLFLQKFLEPDSFRSYGLLLPLDGRLESGYRTSCDFGSFSVVQ
jgi:hypothetical protein